MDDNMKLIGFGNGIYDIDKKSLTVYTTNKLLFLFVGYNYNYDDSKINEKELLDYSATLATRIVYNKTLILYGDGNNKQHFIDLITATFGEYVLKLSLKYLEQEWCIVGEVIKNHKNKKIMEAFPLSEIEKLFKQYWDNTYDRVYPEDSLTKLKEYFENSAKYKFKNDKLFGYVSKE